MSYERVRVRGVRRVANKATGEVHHFVEVDVMSTQSVYMNDAAIKQLPQFEALVGKECLIPVTWGEYKGRPNLNFTDDAQPLPVPLYTPPLTSIDRAKSSVHDSEVRKPTAGFIKQ